MDKLQKKRWTLEWVYWLITGLLAVLLLLPIYQNVENYPFYTYNLLFIFTFFTLTRYIFLLQHSPFVYHKITKLFLAAISIPLAFILFQGFYEYEAAINEYGPEDYFQFKSGAQPPQIIKYINSEMVLFGVSAIFVTLLTPFRMLISIWKTKNRGTY
jgi:hypothetical protein